MLWVQNITQFQVYLLCNRTLLVEKWANTTKWPALGIHDTSGDYHHMYIKTAKKDSFNRPHKQRRPDTYRTSDISHWPTNRKNSGCQFIYIFQLCSKKLIFEVVIIFHRWSDRDIRNPYRKYYGEASTWSGWLLWFSAKLERIQSIIHLLTLHLTCSFWVP